MYTGRFAPSPTGPLHFGSLVAALASFLRARQRAGRWLVRIEDIDPPRQPPDASDQIIRSLQAHGLDWDGLISFQSQHQSSHESAIAHLRSRGLLYPCTCSRKKIRESGAREALPGLGPVYPGTCRDHPTQISGQFALRMRVDHAQISFEDLVQGIVTQDLQRESGDFLIRRSDGLYSYSLATAVDDVNQEITEVIRGADLLHQSPRQIYVMQQLGCDPPDYGHVPVATDKSGQKLSKQTGAIPLDNTRAKGNLLTAMEFLGLPVDFAMQTLSVSEILAWGVANFSLNDLLGITSQAVDLQV